MKRGPSITTNQVAAHTECECCDDYEATTFATCELGIGAISLRRIHMKLCASCMHELIDALQLGLYKFAGEPLVARGAR